MEGKQTYHYNRAVCIYCHECVRSCPKEGAIFQTAEPAPCALKEENINNGWNKLFDEAKWRNANGMKIRVDCRQLRGKSEPQLTLSVDYSEK